jgi:dolichol-phosphate mannosyltransferase
MEKRPCRVTFIVPALNEEAVIENVVRDIWSMVDSRLATYEIVLIDDGSIDRTGAIMDRLAQELAHVRVLHNKPNAGLGASYQRGLEEARLDYVMMLCGDGGLPASSLPPIIDKIGTADIVVPYILNLRQIKSPFRFLVSWSYTRLLNCISGCRLNYYNGLPVHRRALLHKVVTTTSGFGFQGEILVKLIKSGHSFVEVGIMGAETTNKSTIFRFRNILSVVFTLLKLLRG